MLKEKLQKLQSQIDAGEKFRILIKKNKVNWKKPEKDEDYPEFPVDLLRLLNQDDIRAERILELDRDDQIAKVDKELDLLAT